MAGGKIILSLNVGATKANIKSQLDSIINGLKPKVTLDVKIKNKSEIEKLTRDVQRLNQTIAKGAGTKLNSNWGSSINTFKKAEAAMKRIEAEAKRMGITLKKSDLNAFTKAMDSRNLSGAVGVMRKMRTEIEGVKTASKAAFADFGKVNMARGLISQVSAVKNASSELTKDSKVLQRAMSTFLNPDNTAKTRLTAFNTMEKYIQRVTSGLKLANVEVKKFASLDRQMSSMGRIVDKLNAFKKQAANMSGFTGEPFNSGRIDTVIARYEKLQSVINKLKSGQKVKGWDFQSATAEAERLQKVLEKIFAGTKRRSPQAIAGLKSDIQKLIFDVERLGKEWSGLFSNPKLAAGYRDLLGTARRVTNADQLKVARKQLSAFSSEVRAAGKNTLSLGDHFKRTFKYFTMYFGASRLIYESIAAIRTMITNVAQLDSAMVELRKVSDATDLQYKEYFDRTKTSAVELGTTMHDLINATADFARLGYNLDQAEALAKTATIYQRVGDDIESVDQATQSIISTMKAFNIDAEDSMTIVDKFNEVGNNFAISSGGIGDALQRSAASMRAAGNTIDESIALVVAANNVIQDPDVVGTMWKTVSMRIRGAKTELEEAGLETDGMAESTSKLREQIAALTNVTGQGGFDIMEDEDTFKSTYDIMLGIGQVWEQMSDIDQAALLELLAGKRQGNALAATLTNLEDMQKALEVSENSAGSAMREHETWLNSIDAKTQQFKASVESLSSTVFSTDMIKGVVDMGTGFVQTVDNTLRGMQNVSGLVPAIKGISLALATPMAANSIGRFFLSEDSNGSTRIGRIGDSFKKTGRGIKNTFTDGALNGVRKGAGKNGGDVIFRPEGFMKLASAVNLYTVGIAAAVAALVALYAITKKVEADREKRRVNAEKDAESLKERTSSLNELKERYKQLSEELSSGDLSAEEALSKRMEIADIQKQISALVGDEAGQLDLVNGKLSEQLALMDDIQASQFGKWKADNAEAIERAKLEYTAGYRKVYDMSASESVRANRNNKQYEDAYNAYVAKVRKSLGDDIANQFAGHAFDEWSLNLSNLDAEDALSTTQKLVDLFDKMTLPAGLEDEFEGLRRGLEGAEQATQSLVDKNKLLIETYATGELQNNRKYKDIWSTLLAAQDEYNKAVESGDVKAQKEAFDLGKQAYEKFQEGVKSGRLDDKAVNSFYDDYYKDWSESLSQQEIEVNAKVKIKQNAESLKSMMSDIQKTFSKDGKLDLTAILEMDWRATRGDGLADYTDEQISSFKQIAVAASEAGVSVGQFLQMLSEEGVINLDDSQLQYLNDTIANIANDAEALGNLEVAIDYDLNGDGVVGQVKEDIEELEGDHEVNIDVNGDEAYDAVKRYVEELQLAKEAGVDLNKTVYGNVDLNNRQKLQWGEKELYDNRKTLKSWGYSQKDIEQLRGSFSTVMGMSGDFGQNGEIKIAFTPMLQTPNGAKILDQNTVNTYMNTLIDQVTQGGSKPFDAGELLKLDAKGLEIDGQIIKGLIAGIGDSAQQASEQMHIVDSLKDAFQNVKQYADAAGMSVSEYVSAMTGVPEETVSEFMMQVYGKEELDEAEETVENMPEEKSTTVDVKVDGEDGVEKVSKTIEDVPKKKRTILETVDKTKKAIQGVKAGLGSIPAKKQTVLETIDKAKKTVGEVKAAIGKVPTKHNTNLTATDSATPVIEKVKNAIATVARNITIWLTAKFGGLVGGPEKWTGTTHATEGLTLVGERGEELVQSGDKAYFVGTHHPEVVWLKQGDIVYNAQETKQIKGGNKVIKRGVMPALASGTDNAGRLTSPYTSTRTRSSFGFLPANGEQGDNFKLEEELKKALEEIDKKVKESLNNYEHQILIMEKNHVNSSELINVYKDMQAEVARVANDYRAKGLNENSNFIQDLQKQWHDYADKIKELTVQQYEETRKITENAIDLNSLWMQNAVDKKEYDKVLQYSQNIVQNYKYLQEQIHEQAEYYRRLGYTNTSNEVSELSKLWYEYRDKIIETTSQAYAGMVEAAGSAVDNMQSLYSTLLTAGEEYAKSKHVTIDTFQEIVGLGTKYLAHLIDENGQLVINEESIKRVLIAKTKELAINEALNYVAQIRSAVESGNIDQLNALCDATNNLTDASWGLVYAQLSELNLSDEQYRKARQNINYLRGISLNLINNIDEEISSMKGDVEDILEYVKEMVKQEVENHIDALEEQVKHYNEIVDLQKESLKTERERDEYSKKVAKQTKSIAELQSRIEQLRLDDSREALAQRLKLEEELAEKQETLANDQSDHSYNATVDALDKMAKAYEEEKNKEIKILQNTISSEEKIYQMAIARIDKGWNNLYDDLIKWNTEYGSHLNMDITDAWEEALKMAQKYGDYLKFLDVKRETDKNGNTTYTNVNGGRTDIVGEVVSDEEIRKRTTEMKANSVKWDAYEKENQKYGSKYKDKINASAQRKLADRNMDLAAEIEELIGEELVRGDDGVWYLGRVGGRKLYDVYPAYTTLHEGGIVGDRKLFDDEQYALLQKGEVVLTPSQQESLYRRLDAFETMYDKFGKFFNLSGGMPMNTSLYSPDDIATMRGAMTDNSVTTLATTVNVSIHGAVDDAAMAKKYGEQIGNETIKSINDAFYKRGINRSGNVLLKQ